MGSPLNSNIPEGHSVNGIKSIQFRSTYSDFNAPAVFSRNFDKCDDNEFEEDIP